MGSSVPKFGRRRSSNFASIVESFLQTGGLPFSDLLSAEAIETKFKKHKCKFGSIYTTATVLWAFLGQVLQDGKMAACQAAVNSIAAYQVLRGEQAPSADTGPYCVARGKLKEAPLRELVSETAQATQEKAEDHFSGKYPNAKLIDGFTFTMADTLKNQKEYPQQKGQAEGCGFPIARCVAVISLMTACVIDLAIAPYSGKLTGEGALLRRLLPSFKPGDIAVMDQYYCSYMMIALLLNAGVDVCCNKRNTRHTDFRTGKRLGKYDHVVVWKRPPRPSWMDKETYQSIPKTLELREIQYTVTEPGFRTKTLTVVTTLTDAATTSKEDIAELYGYRWNVELDIRSIKSNLNLDHVPCKSPKMVRLHLWTTLLAYNLIRISAACAAAIHGGLPRDISFTATCQAILSQWSTQSNPHVPSEVLEKLIENTMLRISECRVGERDGRIEPRRTKMRPKRYHYLTKPRGVLKAMIISGKLKQ